MTQAFETPVQKILQVWWMTGQGLVPALPCIDLVLDQFARHQGCKTIEVVGRKGFEKLFKPLGGKFLYAAYSRPVRTVSEN